MKNVFPLICVQIFHQQQCYRPANNVFVVGDDIGSMVVKSVPDTIPNIDCLGLFGHQRYSMLFNAIIVDCKF